MNLVMLPFHAFAVVLMAGIVAMFAFFAYQIWNGQEPSLAALCAHEYKFEPTPDITAAQLAEIISHVSGPLGRDPICVGENKSIPDYLLPQFRKLK